MPVDEETGKNRGFAFLKYEDWRSTILAVDNLNGAKLRGRTLRVDHKKDYQPPRDKALRDERGKAIPLTEDEGEMQRRRGSRGRGGRGR